MTSSDDHTLKCNVGCGQTPTRGWRNFDNSPSIRLARIPFLPKLLWWCGVIDAHQQQYMEFSLTHHLEYGDAARGLPLQNGSVTALYTSHMLEHLDRAAAAQFLGEARRVLCKGGIIRIAVPDISKLVESYIASGDADAFISETHLTQPRPRRIPDRLRILLAGARQHQWMYDGASLSKALLAAGFHDARVRPAGETGIGNPGDLDLHERSEESVYVEANNP